MVQNLDPAEELQYARNINKKFIEKYKNYKWFSGSGIYIIQGGNELGFRLNVNSKISEKDKENLPDEFEGFKVGIVHIGNHKSR